MPERVEEKQQGQSENAPGNKAENKNPLPSPTLPKGGGAIRDMGEKFSANPATGAGSLNVPIFTSPGRGSFHPELALQYDTGKGNGPFGIGWSLSVPRITRRTDKGLPRYDDATDSDTYLLSEAEDLVPALVESGTEWVLDHYSATDAQSSLVYDVVRYRPRVEGLYARIERWRRADGDLHWRAITKDNIVSIYGRSAQARIADPNDARRIFTWLLEETRDQKGNVLAYVYKQEDQQGIDQAAGFERTRPVANAYLKAIFYGNDTPNDTVVPISIDATALTAQRLFIPNIVTLDSKAIQNLYLGIGAYSIAQLDLGFPVGTFIVKPDGMLDYDASLDSVFAGRGTATLTLKAQTVTVDATALTSQRLFFHGFPEMDSPAVQHFGLLPGVYPLYQLDLGFQIGAVTVNSDGTLAYDTALDGVFSGRGTATLTVKPRVVALDATALTSQRLFIPGSPEMDSPTVQHLALVPGTYPLRQLDLGFLIGAFTVNGDGTIAYDTSLDGVLSGRGATTLTLKPLAVALDATALTSQRLFIPGSPEMDSPTVRHLALVPGTYPLRQLDLGFLIGVFTVNGDGTLAYDATLDGLFSGRGTSTLTVKASPITLDATALTSQRLFIPGSPEMDSPTVQHLALAPGTYPLRQLDLGFLIGAFTVNGDGTLTYDTALDRLFSGRGTSTLTVKGATVSIDATALTQQRLVIAGIAVMDSKTVQHLILVPGAYPITQLDSGAPVGTFFVKPGGTVDYNASLDGAFSGRDTATLTIQAIPTAAALAALSGAEAAPGTSDVSLPPPSTTPPPPTLSPAPSNPPVLNASAPANPGGSWHFQVLFDYGEHDIADPVHGPLAIWPGRPDPFSDFRPTFEMRTYRLCRRVLMLHRFIELGTDWTVVRSTELTYETNPVSTYLRAVTHKGWQRDLDGTYQTQASPSLDLDYSRPKIEAALHTVDPRSLANLPVGVDGKAYQLVDLDSEGLPGILSQQASAFFYKRNQGEGHFGAVEPIATRPSVAELGSGVQQVTDLDNSGEKFLVQLGRSPQGYFARTAEGWAAFRPFRSLPGLDWSSSELRYLDLDGDGLPDVLQARGEQLCWWQSLGRDGYGPEQRLLQPRDERRAPYLVWSDPRQAVLIADMTGDGLSDIVRVRNGSVDYWPNLGYGRFGARVSMHGAPRFAPDTQFNLAYLRLGDIDGSGTADLIYLDGATARIWLNQSGNGYGAEERVAFPSAVGASVTVTDLLGKGTACLVWSSPLPVDSGRQMRYLDLMSGQKPHLLTSVANNLGATTTITYAPSTEFYLADRAAGHPWVTKLPFPVQVVSSVEVDEAVTGTRLVTTYRYHHGHYDGIEREFAGFGMVEMEDAATLQSGAATPVAYTPPKHTKSWFHTGAFFDAETISTQYAHEYNTDFPQLVPDSLLPSGTTPEEAREAARALRGHLLRQEVYGRDGTAAESHPYLVTESNFELRRVQPKAGNRYGVIDVVPRETLSAHTERSPGDPRLEHELTLAVDAFGNVTESVHLAYPRRAANAEAAQTHTLVTYAQRDYRTLTDATDFYRVDLLRESRTYELTGLPTPAANGAYSHSELAGLVTTINGSPAATPPVLPAEIDFSVTQPPRAPTRRLVERTQQIYLGDQPADESLMALGLVISTRRAVLTQPLIDSVYGGQIADAIARNQLFTAGQYVQDGNTWWAPSGIITYPKELFYQPSQHIDPFGNVSSVQYDAYTLLAALAMTAVGTSYTLTTAVVSDYRALAPATLTDPNGNRTSVTFDALGRVTAMLVMGKVDEPLGDDIAHPSTRIEYHLEAVPAYVYIEKREQHWLPAQDPASSQTLQRAYTYSDGLGREVLTKKQAEPGPDGLPRWIGTGRVVFDNKGNPVQKYEPYFSATPGFESVVQGVSDLLHYDPLDRAVRTDHPNGTYGRIAFDAWTETSYDENDTVGEPGNAWYARFSTGTAEQQDAAKKALAHASTPTTVFVDPLGRTVITQQHNGFDVNQAPILFRTTLDLDIQGHQRTVTDARGVAVATHAFDMLGHTLFAHSVDAGDATVAFDVMGTAVREWKPNSIQIERQYDAQRRPTRVWVTQNGQRRLAERTFYGETLTDAASRNLRGRVFRQLDGAGLITSPRYDFKGNLLSSVRQVAIDFKNAPSWPDIADPADADTLPPELTALLDVESFPAATAYDALNRITQTTLPSGTPSGNHVATPTYNRTGLLQTVAVQFAGDAVPTTFVTDIVYNEKDQRLQIAYGNGVTTAYSYEPDTFRLSTIATTKAAQADLQALSYTYDPVGNITTIRDRAQQTLFFANRIVEPSTNYTYDAIYRLISAVGREHAGQAAPDQLAAPQGAPLPNPNDAQAMRQYSESYQYDSVGNFLAMVHAATNAQGLFQNIWTRVYTPDAASNRLLSTTFGGTTTPYPHDAAGNMSRLPQLAAIDWDYKNQMAHAALGGGGDVYFTYDAAGQRVRKVLVQGTTTKERLYLGAYEIYRERSASGSVSLERRTLHVTDDKRRVALVELRTAGNDGSPFRLLRYQLDNHLGSAVLELDAAASLLSYEEYHPYGTTAYRATATVLTTNPKRYAFTGKERDEETGFTYHDARYYAPWIARWVSADPAKFADGTGLYSYSRGNPIMIRDPSGRQGKTIPAVDPRKAVPLEPTKLPSSREELVKELRHAQLLNAMQRLAKPGMAYQFSDSALAKEFLSELSPGFKPPSEPNADFRGIVLGASLDFGEPRGYLVQRGSGGGLRLENRQGELLEQIKSPPGLERPLLDPIDFVAGFGVPGVRVGVGTLARQLGRSEVQGLSRSQLRQIERAVRQAAADVGGDAAIHGSRAAGTARKFSDLDIAIRVTESRFQQLLGKSFGAPNEGSAKLNTLLHAIKTEKIQTGELKLGAVRDQLERITGTKVDLSAVNIGGPFDVGPFVPLR